MENSLWWNLYSLTGTFNFSCSLLLLVLYSAIYTRYDLHLTFRKLIISSLLVSLGWSLIITSSWIMSDIRISSPYFIVNGFTTYVEFFLIVTFILLLVSLEADTEVRSLELLLLASFSFIALLILNITNDWLPFYLALELHSLSLYVMATLQRRSQTSTEAGLKYFLLGALASGLLLYGLSILYGVTGTTSFSDISLLLTWSDPSLTTPLTIGIALVIIALLFKLGAAPFHSWVADVYDGSPTPVTTYFAVIPKLLLAPLLSRLVITVLTEHTIGLATLLMAVAVISIVIGSIAGLNQSKLKRLLAYSAIAQVGYIMLGIGTGTLDSSSAILIFAVLYSSVVLILFIVITTMKRITGKPLTHIAELTGLSRTQPLLALSLTIALLSSASVPPLIGFYGKWTIFTALLAEKYYAVAIVSLLMSAVSAFYYLRIIKTIYFSSDPMLVHKVLLDVSLPLWKQSFWSSLLLGGLTFLSLAFFLTPLNEGLFLWAYCAADSLFH